jgi:tetraacyldisaccharide 4'-kinase
VIRGESTTLLFILRLITPVYQFFSRRQLKRRLKQCSGDWQAKVISIGNITVGGSGKTPIVGYLAEKFISRSKKVVIVHSGYGRKSTKNLLVDYGKGREFPVKEIGDETAMMARDIPDAAFAVGRNKKKMLTLADQKLKPDVIIIDDGYQRLDIKKDADIAVIDETLIRNMATVCLHNGYRLFPSGLLREKSSALHRADVIFIAFSSAEWCHGVEFSTLRKNGTKVPVIKWILMISCVEHNGQRYEPDILKGKRPCLFAGIGSFSRLKQMVADLGIETIGDISYGDHAEYNSSKIDELNRNSTSLGADCYLTTAKDMVKLPPSGLDKPVYCLRLKVQPDDEIQLGKIISLDAS